MMQRSDLDYDRLGEAFAKALADAGVSQDKKRVDALVLALDSEREMRANLEKELHIAQVNLRNIKDHLKCPDETNISDHAYTVSRKLIDYENEIKELKAEIVEFRFKNKNDS